MEKNHDGWCNPYLERLQMESFLPVKQNLFRLYMIGIRNTAVYRTYSCALRFFVKTGTFRALVGHYKIYFIAYRGEGFININNPAVSHFESSLYMRSVCNSPLYTSFVYGMIRTFGLAGTTIYAFVGYYNGHFKIFIANLIQVRIFGAYF